MGGVIGLVGFVALVVFVIVIGRKGQKKADTEVQLFVQQNGYAFDPKPAHEAVFDTSIFAKSHSLTLRDQVTMPTGRIVVNCFVAEWQGPAASHSTSYLASITPIAGSSFSFNLIPKVMSGLFGFNDQGLQPYQLEGSLNQLYDLYIQPGNEIETLSLLQPDTLLKLSQTSPDSVVIARPGKLFFFYRHGTVAPVQANQAPQSGISIRTLPKVSYQEQFQTVNSITDLVLKNYYAASSTQIPTPPTPSIVVQPNQTSDPNVNA